MKKLLLTLLMFAIGASFAQSTPAPAKKPAIKEVYSQEKEGIFPCPKPKGNGPGMLLLSGGRPWVGNSVATNFADGGYRVKLLNSVYLDGMGGASIKITPNDPVEPEPLDGITPEFERLDSYKIIVINDIPQNMQRKLLTPERVGKLRNYVSSGGALFLTANAPLDLLGDLAPVEKMPDRDEDVCDLEDFCVRRPELPQFQALPQSWGVWQPFHFYRTKANAKMVAEILSSQGIGTEIPYIATMDYGKGKILFWNSQLMRMQTAQQLFNWAYKSALVTAIAATICPGDGVDPAKTTVVPPRELEPKTIPEAKALVSDPVMTLDEKASTATVSGNTISFDNGVRIVVKDKGVDIFYPGIEQAVVSDLLFPNISMPKGIDKVNSLKTAEAVGTQSQARRIRIVWQVKAITGGKEACIELVYGENSCRWIFTTAKLALDGNSSVSVRRSTWKRSPTGCSRRSRSITKSTSTIRFSVASPATRSRAATKTTIFQAKSLPTPSAGDFLATVSLSAIWRAKRQCLWSLSTLPPPSQRSTAPKRAKRMLLRRRLSASAGSKRRRARRYFINLSARRLTTLQTTGSRSINLCATICGRSADSRKNRHARSPTLETPALALSGKR